MKGSILLVAILATILVESYVEANLLRELLDEFQNNYESTVCEQGSYKSYDKDCNQYYKCIDNEYILRSCPAGLHWSSLRNICTLPEEAKCSLDSSGSCEQGSYKSYNKDCNQYYKCVNNKWIIRSCHAGLHWSSLRNICTLPEEAKCSLDSSKSCEKGLYKPSRKDCSKYFKCVNNEWIIRSCPAGLYWSSLRNICTSPDEAKCFLDTIKYCNKGLYKPYDKDCNQYYKCIDNEWILRSCPTGLNWSPIRNLCTSPKEAKCSYNYPEVCYEGSYKSYDKESNQYFKCVNNEWILQECTNGMSWSQTLLVCIYSDNLSIPIVNEKFDLTKRLMY